VGVVKRFINLSWPNPQVTMTQQFCKRRVTYGFVGISLMAITIVLIMLAARDRMSVIQIPYRKFYQSVGEQQKCIDTSNRTLLVITGQIRTMTHVWESILMNIVQPNEPCDVILSVDGNRESIPDVVLDGLGPHIVAILTTESEKPVGNMEFWLVARVIQKVYSDRYRFFIKTRTDLYHRIPIRLKTLFAESNDFIHFLHEFHKVLMKKTGQTTISVGETLYAWLITGGMAEFITPMLVSTPNAPWSRLHQHDWSRDLRRSLLECSTSRTTTMESQTADNDALIVYCVRFIFQKYRVLYNIGSPWLQFGQSHHLMSLSTRTLEEFGTHTWADAGFNDSDSVHINQWKHVPESHIRLTYLKMGFNVIDLINHPDFHQSFTPILAFQQAKFANYLTFFIVRNSSLEH
jgi:hypothetical protein